MQKKIILALVFSFIIIGAAVGIFSFQQLSDRTPSAPSGFILTELSSTRLDLTWVKAKNADTTYIERNNVSAWKKGEGTLIYNDTGVHYLDNVPHHSQYYYQAWSWNRTEHAYSSMFAKTNTTLVPNQPPIFGLQTPANRSTGTLLSISWAISINDPEGNLFTWTIQCSNGQVSGGANAYNGTKTIHLFSLENATTYKVWVNATDPTGSELYTRRWYTFTTTSNQTTNTPPVFGTPSPANGSTGNLLVLTWGILISDHEANPFTWTIQCSNRQLASGMNAYNGTRTLILSGLAYSTSYKVWVNATDPTGSGLVSRRWYTFTTKSNQVTNNPPVFGTPSPANGSAGNPLNLTWSIPINDPEANPFTWTIQCNGKTNNGTGASDGIKTLSLPGLANATHYKVWVNATDPTGSGLFSRRWFTFTTKLANNSPPVFGTPSPLNGSLGSLLSLTWSIPINDPNGDTFSWTIQCSNGQVTTGVGQSNGTESLALSGLAYSTGYKIWVNATDQTGSGEYTRKWYTFSTKANSPPVFGATTPINHSINIPLNLTWSISITDPEGDSFSWTIQCNNTQSNSSTNATNGTRSLSLTGLVFSATYKIWVNATDPTGSGLYTKRWYLFTTKVNRSPIFEKPSPANRSTNNQLNLSWSIFINDSEGNTFSWVIQCNNGQKNNGTNATNGTKSLLLSNLTYATTYKIWVNATDPNGSGLYTRRWYIFTTKADQPPNPPTITGSAKGTIKVPTVYNFTAIDPENQSVYYFIDWGDGTNSSWIGPNASGAVVAQTHTWSKRGAYTIKAKAKDIKGAESNWSTLPITMPYSYHPPLMKILVRLFALFPHAFPILQHLLGN